jgi:hypothetical protein
MTDSVVLLVEEALPRGLPTSVRNQLVCEARKLHRDAIDREVVKEALREWARRPGLSPGMLPHLVSDVQRTRRLVKAARLDWEAKLQEEMS